MHVKHEMPDTKPLTQKQENFCQVFVIEELIQTDAYKAAGYSFENKSPATIYQAASRLAADSKVVARIQELRDAVTAAVTGKRAWDSVRLIDEAETNLLQSRQLVKMAAANGASKLIGRTAGLLTEQLPEQSIRITRVTVVLNRGQGDVATESRQVVDSTSRTLDPPEEESPA